MLGFCLPKANPRRAEVNPSQAEGLSRDFQLTSRQPTFKTLRSYLTQSRLLEPVQPDVPPYSLWQLRFSISQHFAAEEKGIRPRRAELCLAGRCSLQYLHVYVGAEGVTLEPKHACRWHEFETILWRLVVLLRIFMCYLCVSHTARNRLPGDKEVEIYKSNLFNQSYTSRFMQPSSGVEQQHFKPQVDGWLCSTIRQ
jgi:hypothetical protein